jgi:plastocyanin
LPNELWIQAGDSIRGRFPHERHTLTFLTRSGLRPAARADLRHSDRMSGTSGYPMGPALTAFPVSVREFCYCLKMQACSRHADLFRGISATGNFKFVCLVHADMTGVVHVVSQAVTLPHDQLFYDVEALGQLALLLGDASRLRGRDTPGGGPESKGVAAGVGEVVTTTGAGSQTASLMRFLRDTIVVRVGDTVEWTSSTVDKSHRDVWDRTRGSRPASVNVSLSSDGARQAVLVGNVNSGFLSPAPQDRANLAQSAPGITRFRVTFMASGTYNYICAVHDQLGMKGSVIVNP